MPQINQVKIDDKVSIEVGDVHSDTFQPQVKMKFWDNECNSSVRLIPDDDTPVITSVDDVITYTQKEKKVRIYNKNKKDVYDCEGGGSELELILLSKPKSNIIHYTVRTKNVDWFYQPALTKEEIREGVERPAHVRGSYAVYHSSKMHNEYKTGKAFHLFRPWARDQNGKQVWCELKLIKYTDLLTITIPKDFYETATYPVVIDPTFGYTTAGASSYAPGSNYAVLCKGTPTSNGTVDSITAYTKYSSSSGSIKAVIWDYSTKAVITNGVGGTVALTSTAAWQTANYTTSPSISSSTNYYVGYVTETFNYSCYYDTGSAGDGGYASSNSYSSPTSIGSIYNNNYKFSVYATYTAGAASASPTELDGIKLHYYKQTSSTNSDISSDNFNDNSLASFWTNGSWSNGGGSYTLNEQNTRLETTTTTDTSATEEAGAAVYQDSISGDLDVQVKITSASNTGPGNILHYFLIVRDSADHYKFMVGARYGNYVPSTGGVASGKSSNASFTEPSIPYYVRIKRIGTTYTGYTSTDGSTWTQRYQETIATSDIDTTDTFVELQQYSYQESQAVTQTVYWDDFVNNSVTVGGIEDMTLYTTTSGISSGEYLNVYTTSGTAYTQIGTDTSDSKATDLRIRKDGTTYAVFTTWSGA